MDDTHRLAAAEPAQQPGPSTPDPSHRLDAAVKQLRLAREAMDLDEEGDATLRRCQYLIAGVAALDGGAGDDV